jgi:hypothetical protein
MAYVAIPKDLSRIKTKFALGLTKRQIVCFASAAVMGLPLFFLAKAFIPTTVAAFLMIIVMVPWFLFAMYERSGLPLELFLRHVIDTKFIRPKYRVYQTNDLYSACAKQARLYKEVKDIANN